MALKGGGIFGNVSDPSFVGDVFRNNLSEEMGGGLMFYGPGNLNLDQVIVEDNHANWAGGMGFIGCDVKILNSNISHNLATSMGGGLHLFNCHLQMDSCSLDGNTALEYSGAMEYAVDTLVFDSLFVCTLSGTQIINNHSGNVAGGMSIQQTHTDHPLLDLRIDKCLIADNSAHHVGGFRIFRCKKPLVLSNTIVRGNIVEAWTAGGTISQQSQGHVYNCLFSDNHAATVDVGATSGGLGIASLDTKVDVNYCTFVGNSAGRGGGLQVYRGANTIVSNSIFWDNYPAQLTLSSVLDTLPCKLTLNYNDIQYGSDSINITDTVSTLVYGEGNMDKDPLFMDASQADYHLMDTSPAIGAGKDSIEVEGMWMISPPFDMEGNPRPNPSGSRPDLGAFENIKAWPVGIAEHPMDQSGEFEELTYPNPFQYTTNFEFNVPEPGQVTLEIFNLLGEQVHMVKFQHLEPGMHSVIWSPTQLENHIYFYRIRMESVSNQVFIKTGQILKID